MSSGIVDAMTVATGPDRVAAKGYSVLRVKISLQVSSILRMIAVIQGLTILSTFCVEVGVVRWMVSVVATAGISAG